MNGGPSETIEVEALIATSVLDADNVPNQNQSETCFSCNAEMVGLYCKDCGQKNDDYRRSIFFLGVEAFTSIFSLESRMWKTWWSLLRRPGQAAREYADGRRTLWTSPVRIYLAMSIVLFGYLSLTETRIISVRPEIQAREGVVGPIKDLADNQVRLSPQFHFFARQKTLDELNQNTDFERVEAIVKGYPHARLAYDQAESLEDLPDGLDEQQDTAEARDWLNYTIMGATNSETLTETILEDIDRELEKLEENQAESDLTDFEKAQEAAAFVLKKQDRTLTRLNRFLRHYPDSITFAKSLSDRTRPLAAESFMDALPENLTPDKRAELEKEIGEILTSLQENGITQDTVQSLQIDETTRSGFQISTITLNGKEMDFSATQKLTMKVLRQPEVLNQGFSKYLPRTMFFMMPFAMFIGIIFIRGRKNALMFDHLVHAAYIHAVAFMFLLVLIVLSQWTGTGGLWKFFFWGMVIYLPISAKTMFKRGWFKTLLMTYSIGFQYSLVMFIIIVGLLASQLNQTVASV